MMPREVPGGIVRRWYCYNPHCRYPFHETRWCPEELRSAGAAAPPPLPPELPPDHEPTLWEVREERLRRVAEEAERARQTQPAAPPNPGYGWLWEFIPVVVVFAIAMLVLVLAAH